MTWPRGSWRGWRQKRSRTSGEGCLSCSPGGACAQRPLPWTNQPGRVLPDCVAPGGEAPLGEAGSAAQLCALPSPHLFLLPGLLAVCLQRGAARARRGDLPLLQLPCAAQPLPTADAAWPGRLLRGLQGGWVGIHGGGLARSRLRSRHVEKVSQGRARWTKRVEVQMRRNAHRLHRAVGQKGCAVRGVGGRQAGRAPRRRAPTSGLPPHQLDRGELASARVPPASCARVIWFMSGPSSCLSSPDRPLTLCRCGRSPARSTPSTARCDCRRRRRCRCRCRRRSATD